MVSQGPQYNIKHYRLFCQTNGLSDQWAVGPMGCQTNGLSDQWAVLVVLSDQWAVGPMGRFLAIFVGPMGCRTNGLSDYRADTNMSTPPATFYILLP